MSLRIVFMGTPDFSVPILNALIGQGHEIVAVYSQPPRPAGRRGLELTPSPVHRNAEQFGIEVRTPKSLKDPEEQQAFIDLQADVAIVVAYGLILPKAILEGTRLGCYNGHASLLPRWRGAAPIQRAIMAGDAETAAMVMRMDEGLDTGPVCLAESIAIGPEMTAGELHDRMALVGAGLVVKALAALERGSMDCRPQPEAGVTYARKIGNDEARIDFNRQATDVHNLIRGLSPAPGAWFQVTAANGTPERIKVLRATLAEGAGVAGTVLDDVPTIACGDGAVQRVQVQRAGKRPMTAAELLRGFALPAGSRVG